MISNPSLSYRCEFDIDTATSKVVVVLRNENGGAIEIDYTDLTAAQYASIMLDEAVSALHTLAEYGFEEGIRYLGLAVDDPTEFTIEDVLGSE